MPELGEGGGSVPAPQYLADQLTLFQPGTPKLFQLPASLLTRYYLNDFTSIDRKNLVKTQCSKNSITLYSNKIE